MSLPDKSPGLTRVVHFCPDLGPNDASRALEAFCRHYDSTRFEVIVLTRGASLLDKLVAARKEGRSRIEARITRLKAQLGENHVLSRCTARAVHAEIRRLAPDILHVHATGGTEAQIVDPASLPQVPVVVTTNLLGTQYKALAAPTVKRIFFVSHWTMENKADWAYDDERSVVLYCPVEKPKVTTNLRAELGIANDAFVVGQVPPLAATSLDPIAFRAYREIQDQKTYFVALYPSAAVKKLASELGLKNFIALDSHGQPDFRSRFYNTIDVLAHARRDGETFGYSIAEAMIHGRPAVSHQSGAFNAQAEIIGDAGFVVKQDDYKEYSEVLTTLKRASGVRQALSTQARMRAEDLFEAGLITNVLEETYLKLLGTR